MPIRDQDHADGFGDAVEEKPEKQKLKTDR